jgi:hypothetical protein
MLYDFTCKTCNRVETLKYKTYWYRKNVGTGNCKSCRSKNSKTLFKKGHKAWNAGLNVSGMTDKKQSEKQVATLRGRNKINNPAKSNLARIKMSLAKIGKPGNNLGKTWSVATEKRKNMGARAENHWKWKANRADLKKNERKHLDSRYREWAMAVKKRDGWSCLVADANCSGRLEAHHILRWNDFPEKRYDVNNGITLCHFHHPRKVEEEKRLASFFVELVSVSSKTL